MFIPYSSQHASNLKLHEPVFKALTYYAVQARWTLESFEKLVHSEKF